VEDLVHAASRDNAAMQAVREEVRAKEDPLNDRIVFLSYDRIP
jgi:hypothetical protein